MENFESKTQKVLGHLLKYKTITSWEAIQKYRATRLSAIIFDLKKMDYNIVGYWTDRVDKEGNRQRFYEYKYIPSEGE